ncbi:unnamed protein product [Umbelopsis ramanniana]
MPPENNDNAGKRKNVSGITRPDLQRSVPTFLSKLYNMVNDPASTDLIRWSNDGTSFIVERHEEFAAKVLPRFFKHNTFASFVRQLNMYDFHKVPHIMQGVMVSENEGEVWEFSNSNFQRDQPDLLLLVSRKRTRDRDEKDATSTELSQLINDIASIKRHQTTISTDLRNLQRDNLIIWEDNLAAREKHERHQDMIQKILRFLATVFSTNQIEMFSKEKDFILENRRESETTMERMYHQGGSHMPPKQNQTRSVNQDALDLNLPALIQSAKGAVSGAASPATTPSVPTTPLTTASIVAAALGSTPFGPSPSPVSRHPSESSYSGATQHRPSPNSTVSTKESESSPPDNINISQQSSDLAAVAKSAESINDDIDALQDHIESLANQLGFDSVNFGEEMDGPDINMFMNQHDNLITGASYTDRVSLFDMIGNPQAREAALRSGSMQDNASQTSAANGSSKQEDGSPYTAPTAIGGVLKPPVSAPPPPGNAHYPWPPHMPIAASAPPVPSPSPSSRSISESYPIPTPVIASPYAPPQSPYAPPHHTAISPMLHQAQTIRSGPPPLAAVPGMYDPTAPVVPGIPPAATPPAGYPGYPYMGQPMYPGMYYPMPPGMTQAPHLPSTAAPVNTPPFMHAPPPTLPTTSEESEPATKKLRTESPVVGHPSLAGTPPHPAMPMGVPPYHPAYAHMPPHMMYGHQMPASGPVYPFYASAFPHGYPGYPPHPSVAGYPGMTTPVPVTSHDIGTPPTSNLGAAKPNVPGSETE